MPEPVDAELAIRAANGDHAAFAILMRRYKARLYQLIRRHVGDPDEAYDVLQESFVSAWRALVRFDRQRPFYAWLARIALNKCRDRGRRLLIRRLFREAVPLDAAGGIPDPSPTPDTIAGDREALGRLADGMARLPAKLKEPLILTALDGLTQAEAADVLGVSVKTIETRVYRARQKLAAMLS